MILIHSLAELHKDVPLVFAIGFFDGFHLGHQKVIETARQLAASCQAQLGIITFYPHPASVLQPGQTRALLQTKEEKIQCMERLGAETAVILRPTKEFLQMEPEDFLEELGHAACLKGLAAGSNFTFGRGGRGTPEFMKTYFHGTGVEVEEVPLLTSPILDSRPVSSTAIRTFLQEGRMEEAAALLGRPYTLSGIIRHGARRGTDTVGFPTANLEVPPERVLPLDGVYATRSRIGGMTCASITNIGKNPTFDGVRRTIETFLFDFHGNIYGNFMTVEWAGRIRGEVKFESPEALRNQIAADVKKAKELLS